MASRFRFNVSDIYLGLLDSQSVNDLGLVASEDNDCDDGDVGSYLPEVQPDVKEPPFSEEDVMDTIPGACKCN